MQKTLYIGAKCVPSFYIGSGGSSDWASGVPFEPLTIVTYETRWYISKKPVPAAAGAPEPGEYWALVPGYITELDADLIEWIQDHIGDLEDDVQELQGDVTELRDDLAFVENTLGGVITLDSLTSSGKYIGSDGSQATTTLAFACSGMYPIAGMDKLHIVRSPRISGGYSIGFYTDKSFSASNFISGFAYNGVTENQDVSIPATAEYVAFSSRTNEGNFIVEMVYSNQVAQIQKNVADIDDIKKVLGGEITLDDLTTPNYFIDTNGSLTYTTLSISSSEMYPTIGLDKLHIVRSPRLASAWSIAFYTDSVFSADNFISGWVYNGVTEDLDVTIPASANYVAFCSRTNEGNFIVDMVFSDVLEQTQNNTSELNEILLSHKGEYISFLGDSITSYLYYIPRANAAFYPVSWFTGVERTWWYKLIQKTQMTLLVNNSSSGSHMATDAELSGLSRCENLDDGTNTPNHIIIFMGINDFVNGNGVVGECGQNQATYSIDNFSDAYYTALLNIKTKYPNAKLYLGTIMQFAKESTFPNVKHNNPLTLYNEAIRKLSDIFGAKVIEFNKCGVDYFNNDTTLGDELHPNYVGHNLMFEEALKSFVN